MATLTTDQKIDRLSFYNLPNQLKPILREIKEATEQDLEDIEDLVLTPLTAITATYGDLADARTSVNTLKTEVDARLDLIESKMNEILEALKAE